jgi:hypothetical protein
MLKMFLSTLNFVRHLLFRCAEKREGSGAVFGSIRSRNQAKNPDQDPFQNASAADNFLVHILANRASSSFRLTPAAIVGVKIVKPHFEQN